MGLMFIQPDLGVGYGRFKVHSICRYIFAEVTGRD